MLLLLLLPCQHVSLMDWLMPFVQAGVIDFS